MKRLLSASPVVSWLSPLSIFSVSYNHLLIMAASMKISAWYCFLILSLSVDAQILKNSNLRDVSSNKFSRAEIKPVSSISLPLYVSCGTQTDYKDSHGVTWISDSPFAIGGIAASSADISNPIATNERYWDSVTSDSGEKVVLGNTGVYMVTIYLACRTLLP